MYYDLYNRPLDLKLKLILFLKMYIFVFYSESNCCINSIL